jgi:glycosyltransferase involved in cell wall biosynthesis
MFCNQKIQVFIASFNRPEYLRESIDSVLGQTAISMIEIIVSDNSTNDDVQMMMETDYSSLKYIKRQPSLPADEHFKAIISDVTSEFYMIFHDDDIMHPQLVENLYNELFNDLNLVAVSANGCYYFPEKKSLPTIYFSWLKKIHFKNPVNFVKKYLIGLGVAPFSGYMYRSSVYTKSFINKEDGGKHSDVSFLVKGLDFGAILWLNRPLMYYRIHGSNDSATISFVDREKIVNFVTQNTAIKPSSFLVDLYRMHDYNVILKYYIMRHDLKISKRDLKRAVIFFIMNIHILFLVNIPLLIYKYLIRLFNRIENPYYNIY